MQRFARMMIGTLRYNQRYLSSTTYFTFEVGIPLETAANLSSHKIEYVSPRCLLSAAFCVVCLCPLVTVFLWPSIVCDLPFFFFLFAFFSFVGCHASELFPNVDKAVVFLLLLVISPHVSRSPRCRTSIVKPRRSVRRSILSEEKHNQKEDKVANPRTTCEQTCSRHVRGASLSTCPKEHFFVFVTPVTF